MKKNGLLAVLLLILCVVCVAAADDSDFVIDENGTLTAYTGEGGDIIIPDGVKVIADGVFSCKQTITSVIVPQTVVTIGDQAFYQCSLLRSITLPNSLKAIGFATFFQCIELASIDFPDSLQNIGKLAFYDCSNLSSPIVIPKNVSCVSEQAFWGCTMIPMVTLSEGVNELEYGAFGECGSLKKVIIPDSVTRIDSHAFYIFDNDNRTTIYCNPGSYADRWADENGYEVRYPQNDAQGRLTDSISWKITGDTLTINGKGEATVPNDSVPWRKYNNQIKKITISEGITRLGSGIIDGLQIRTLSIPKSVDKIDGGSIVNCPRLVSIDVVAGNEEYISVDGVLFDKQKTLICKYPEAKEGTTYQIPRGVTVIDYGAFSQCKNLKKVIIPETVTVICSTAFARSGIQSISIPDSVISIHPSAFYKCYSLSEVSLSQNIVGIENATFWDCTSLVSIEIPESVLVIDSWAFNGCSALKEIKLPDNLLFFESGAFDGCTSLERINIPKNQPGLPYSAFNNCVKLKSLALPNSIVSLEAMSLQSCNSLKTLTLPDSVEYIKDSAINCCEALESITIGHGLKRIDNCGICCINLKELTVYSVNAEIDENGISLFPEQQLLVKGYEGSTIQAWAKKHGQTFESLGEAPVEFVEITGVKNSTVKLGYTLQLKPTQKGTEGAKYTFKSSDKKVATVSKKGEVKALKAGTAIITITSSLGAKKEIKITVKSVKISLNKTKLTLSKGKTFQLEATQKKTKGAKFTYKTDNKKVATVDKKGKIKAVKAGTATITVTSSFGETAKVKVTVK